MVVDDRQFHARHIKKWRVHGARALQVFAMVRPAQAEGPGTVSQVPRSVVPGPWVLASDAIRLDRASAFH